MRIEQLIELVTNASKGKDNIKEGSVGSNDYGFVFKNPNSSIPFVTVIHSHKYCEAGSSRDALKNWYKYKNFEDIMNYSKFDELKDLILAGSLKTLAPSLIFGGYNIFTVWMFVKTPNARTFPAVFYWGSSGVSIGGWASYGITPFAKEIIFPEDFLEIVNFSPFKFTDDEQGCFLDALEFALKKAPVSDFWGLFNRDIGNSFMGIRKGEPFNKLMPHSEYDPEAEKEIEPLIGKEFKNVYNESFTIKRLPGMPNFVIQFEKDVEPYDIIFGNAKRVLEYWRSQNGPRNLQEIRRRGIEKLEKLRTDLHDH